MDDLAERHLQEAGPERLERLDVAGALEAVARPRPSRGLSSPRAASARSTLRATPAPEVTSVTPRPSIRCSIGATSG